MRIRSLALLTVLVITAVFLFFFFSSRETRADYGEAIALCPGPDQYGYRCESGTAFAYIDATNDTRLYAEEGHITLDLPFPFTFYGTTYTQVNAAVNGYLQFGSSESRYLNECLEPASGMGDLLAPYWDDLDLRFFGFLETELVGEAPNRIYVIEWDDIPLFGSEDERVTFEVQLFEGSNDIVFLYQDVTVSNGNNGSSATIGLQSELQGLALQYSCNQATVANASSLIIRHPELANEEVGGLPNDVTLAPPPLEVPVKGALSDLTADLNAGQTAVQTVWNQYWLSQTPPRLNQWEWVDLTGNGRLDLALLQHSTSQFPSATRLLVWTADETSQLSLTLEHYFSDRQTAVTDLTSLYTGDLTHDGVADLLMRLPETGEDFVLTWQHEVLTLHPLPDQCTGSWTVQMEDENGRFLIIRDGCRQPGRQTAVWDGSAFQTIQP